MATDDSWNYECGDDDDDDDAAAGYSEDDGDNDDDDDDGGEQEFGHKLCLFQTGAIH